MEMGADIAASSCDEGYILIRVHVPELNIQKCLQFPRDQLVWDVKQQCLAALPKELKESFNYGLFCPPENGRAGKFLDEERRLGDYSFNGPMGYLELKYKRRVYKMMSLDEKQLKSLHTRANLRRFIDYVQNGQVEKISKMCSKGLDPNFHCQDSGETPLTMATGLKKSTKVLMALVNGGALLDYRTKDGSTSMHRSVEHKSLESLKTLLGLGASPNYKDAKGLTPLYLAVTHNVDPELSEMLLHDHAITGAQDLQGWQEVHQACKLGLLKHLEHLLFYGANMNARNASGNTPLHVCAVNGQESCARQLLFRGADRQALNYANQTPCQVAVIAGNMELAEIIQNYRQEDVVPYRGPPSYNPKRRSAAIGWLARVPSLGNLTSLTAAATTTTTLGNHHQRHHHRHSVAAVHHHNHHMGGRHSGSTTAASRIQQHRHHPPPSSPCPSDRSLAPYYSSASSSLSEGSSSCTPAGHETDSASIVTDKSLGDTSDIISDSSGVGTANSDSTNCSISLPGTTVVCIESYQSTEEGHLSIRVGDMFEVTGATDDGYLEGNLRGSVGKSGLFPAYCVQEVRLRNHHMQTPMMVAMDPRQTIRNKMNSLNSNSNLALIAESQPHNHHLPGYGSSSTQVVATATAVLQSPTTTNSTAGVNGTNGGGGNGARVVGRRETTHLKHFATAPRSKKTFNGQQLYGGVEPRTVVLHRGRKGFGFVLRGAKAMSPLLELTPSAKCPSLQYLDDVDPGGVADLAGLKKGDFLLQINNEDVSVASHEHVVDLIRNSGGLVQITAVTIPSEFAPTSPHPIIPSSKSSVQLVQPANALTNGNTDSCGDIRQYAATLPRKLANGRPVAPLPPRRDPKTTLSVGRARAKSMVLGMEVAADEDQAGSNESIQSRTNTTKQRPISGRVTSTELEEVFERRRNSDYQVTNKTVSSRTESNAIQKSNSPSSPTPSATSTKSRVYASVAEMKRSKSKTATLGHKSRLSQLFAKHARAQAEEQLAAAADAMDPLRRNFHSTPDLVLALQQGTVSPLSSSRTSTPYHCSSKSQENVSVRVLLSSGGSAGGVPPPSHPPPPPPFPNATAASPHQSSGGAGAIESSFRPTSSAKLYASPEDVQSVIYRNKTSLASTTATSAATTTKLRKAHSMRSNTPGVPNVNSGGTTEQPYAQPTRKMIGTVNNTTAVTGTSDGRKRSQENQGGGTAPPVIPEPDYSCSGSEGEDVTNNGTINRGSAIVRVPVPSVSMQPVENSGNSNASGISTGSTTSSSTSSGSAAHSFSVEEIQRGRSMLKSSKSYPDDFLLKRAAADVLNDVVAAAPGHDDNGDNSSSGVSSDQETNTSQPVTTAVSNSQPEKRKHVIFEYATDHFSNNNNSMTLPSAKFRHQSRKGGNGATSLTSRNAVSLAQIPPPLTAEESEICDADEQHTTALTSEKSSVVFCLPPPPEFDGIQLRKKSSVSSNTSLNKSSLLVMKNSSSTNNGEVVVPGTTATQVLAPPPQFSDNRQVTRVRIVGAVPKPNTPTISTVGGGGGKSTNHGR